MSNRELICWPLQLTVEAMRNGMVYLVFGCWYSLLVENKSTISQRDNNALHIGLCARIYTKFADSKDAPFPNNYHFSNCENANWSRASNAHRTLSQDGISFIVGRTGGLKESIALLSPSSRLLLGALNKFFASFLKRILLRASSCCIVSSSNLLMLIKLCWSQILRWLVTFSMLPGAWEWAVASTT